jgi:hypothetical protein
MQTSDATLRHHMRGFTLPQTNAPLEGYISPDQEHWGPVIAAMQAHNNMRGVTGADWAAVLQEDTHLESVAEMLTTFLDEALLEEHDTAQYISEIPRPQRATHHILSEAFRSGSPWEASSTSTPTKTASTPRSGSPAASTSPPCNGLASITPTTSPY